MAPEDTIDPTTAIDTVRRLLTDFSRCPSCATVLLGRLCPACGVDLTGKDAQRVGELSVRAAQTLTERQTLIGQMRGRTQPAVAVQRPPDAPAGPVRVTPPAPAPPVPSSSVLVPPVPSASVPTPPVPVPPVRATGGPELPSAPSGPGVHGLLVGLGALLLSVAAVGFLVFSWHVLSLSGRAAVIALATFGVLATASWLRSRLPETAEAVGALGVVLVLADGWAIRRTGLFGADQPDPISYAAATALVSAVLLGGWALISRVRAGSWAAVTLAPLALVLLAARLDDGPEPVFGPVPVFAIGLLLVAGLALGRGALPVGWQAERRLLRAYTALALLGVWAPAAIGRPGSGRAAAVLVAAGLLAGFQTVVDRRLADRLVADRLVADRPVGGRLMTGRSRSLRLRRGWSLSAGIFIGTAAVQAGLALATLLKLDGVSVLVPLTAVPMLALVAAAAIPTGPVLRRTAFAAGTAVVAALAAVPVLLLAGWLPLRAGLIGVRAWSAGVGDRFGDLDPQSATVSAWAVALTGLVLVAAGAVVATRIGGWPAWLARPVRWAAVAAAGIALVVLPLLPSAPVGAVVGGLLLVAIAAGTRFRSGGLLLLSGVTGTLAVLLAWSSRGLSVPVTLLGVAGLLMARRLTVRTDGEDSATETGRKQADPVMSPPRRYDAGWNRGAETVRAALAGAALLSLVVVVGAVAGLVGAPSSLWVVWAGTAGGLSVAGFLGLPRWWPRPGRADWNAVDRLAAAVPGLLALVLGLLATLPEGPIPAVDGAAWPRPVLLAVALLVAVTGAGAVRPAIVRAVPALPLLAALAITPLLGATAAAIRASVTSSEPRWPALSLLWAVAAAVGALAMAVVVLSGRADPGRRVAAEIGVLFTAVIGLVLVNDPDSLWPVLLVLGAGAAAVAATPDRHRIGWLAGLLLTGSTWTRLAVGNVDLVEAYSLPPAFALLLLALYRFHRDRTTDPARALLPVAAVGLGPSIVVAAAGSAVRPAVLIVTAAVLLLGGRAALRSGRSDLGSVLAGVGVLSAVGTAALRAAHTLGDGTGPGSVSWTGLEVWTVPAGTVLVLAALTRSALTWGGPTRSGAGDLAPIPAPVERERPVPPLVELVRWAAAPPLPAGLLLLGVPTLLAALVTADRVDGVTTTADPTAVIRVAVVLTLSILIALAALRSWPRPGPDHPARAGLSTGATALAATASVIGLTLSYGPAEIWTVPLAALLLIRGRDRFAAFENTSTASSLASPGWPSSWAAHGPGLLVLLLPSLYLALTTSTGSPWREITLITLAAATLARGAVHRLQAPVLLGAAALGTQAVALLLPWFAELSGAVPLWGWLAAVGLALIVLGARYEARIAQLRTVRLRIAALR